MKALVLEDDELIGELLQTIVLGLYPGASVRVADRLADAQAHLRQSDFDLFLVDWNLPDGSGLQLVRKIRLANTQVPIVIVTARADRDSVLKAAHHGISGYITKPFNVETVHQRLRGLLKPDEESTLPEVGQLLASALEEGQLQLSFDMDPGKIVSLMDQGEHLSSSELAREWRGETALTARLLDIANSSAFRRTGQPVGLLQEAINLMGVQLALKQALALALDASAQVSDDSLKRLTQTCLEQAEQVAELAETFARRLGKPPAPFYQAGLLSRIGELSVLRVLNQFVLRGGHLVEAELARLLREWAPRYGNALKVQWRLPLGLREMVGAVHVLPSAAVRDDLLVMRAAALSANPLPETRQEYQRLLRRTGLDTDREERLER